MTSAKAALIVGLEGLKLTIDERKYLADARPAGLILFARNCGSPNQLTALVGEARSILGDDVLIAIDQEGGRVQRLAPPHWRRLPTAADFLRVAEGDVEHAADQAFKIARLTAHDLRQLGITMNCAPVLDLRWAGAHDIIGDRAYSSDVGEAAVLGRAVANGLIAGGVVPVIKHIPGHGRALADSHLTLPTVEANCNDLCATDFEAFRRLNDLPAAMTAHVVYSAYDPINPASVSPTVTQAVIRDHIGFDGLLMSDDLSMQALTGSIGSRAQAVIAAGSDIILHCNGNLREMVDAAAAAPFLVEAGAARLGRCLRCTEDIQPFDHVEAIHILDDILGV